MAQLTGCRAATAAALIPAFGYMVLVVRLSTGGFSTIQQNDLRDTFTLPQSTHW